MLQTNAVGPDGPNTQTAPVDWDDVCRRIPMADYLEKRGVILRRSGKRWCCRCPLHDDRDPSFYFGENSKGVELFHCFGCSASGNVLTLIKRLDGKPAKAVAAGMGMDVNAPMVEVERTDVISDFCAADAGMLMVAEIGIEFMHAHDADEVVVDLMSEIYRYMDELIAINDEKAIEKTMNRLLAVVSKYRSK